MNKSHYIMLNIVFVGILNSAESFSPGRSTDHTRKNDEAEYNLWRTQQIWQSAYQPSNIVKIMQLAAASIHPDRYVHRALHAGSASFTAIFNSKKQRITTIITSQSHVCLSYKQFWRLFYSPRAYPIVKKPIKAKTVKIVNWPSRTPYSPYSKKVETARP